MSNLRDQIKSLENSSSFQKAALNAINENIARGINIKIYSGKLDINVWAKEMKQILSDEISAHGYEFGKYIVIDTNVNVENHNGNPVFTIGLHFDEDGSNRDSLYPEVCDDGVNIARLLNTGYDAARPVFGYWNGEFTQSLTSREGMFYIQDAIREFNSMAPDGVKAIYVYQDA